MPIPFLRPHQVELGAYAQLLAQLDATRRYSNFGPYVTTFEQRIVSQLFDGRGAAITVNNATLGLMLAIKALQRPAHRYAAMPSFTFAALPLAAMWCGLTPYFVDVDPHDWCLDVAQVERVLHELGRERAVVVIYATFGAPMDLTPYQALQARGVPVVVDAAPSLGTRTAAGAFAAGFAGPVVYSMHATKAFSVGEGGLIYSGDGALIERLRRMSNFGFDAGRASADFGLNAKMHEVTAAIALATLAVYPQCLARRMALFETYRAALREAGLIERGWQLQSIEGDVPHQFMPVLTPPGASGAQVVSQLAERGIEARRYFAPACHTHPQFAACPRAPLPVTDDLAARCVSLPLWDEMPVDQVHEVVAALGRCEVCRAG